MMPDAVCSFVLVSTVLVVTSARVVHTAVVSDDFHFSFDPVTNLLVGHNAYTCILAPLTHTEQMDIHYGRGMENLEIEMMRDWVGHIPEVKVYHHDPQLSQTVNRWCDNKEIYLLNRSIQDASTTSATGPGFTTLSTTSVASNSQFSTPEMTSSQFSTTLATKTSQSLALSSTTLPQFSTTSSPALSSLGYFQQSSSPAESTLSPLPIQFSTASSSQPYTTSDSNLPTPSSRPSTATESSVTTSNIQSLSSEKPTTETEVVETTTSDSSHFSNQTTGSFKTTSAASNKTTIAIHATATSHHTAKTTISSAVAPFVVYDNATQIKAVIVVGEDCYVYQLSVVETLMVKMGEETKDSLEKALLAMDRQAVSDVTDKYPSILQDKHVKQYCSRQIFSFN